MAVVNIPRDVKDEFYRYKMPALIAKVEGRGNGIKTVIVNMSDIAKSLARPPEYPTKFFGFELGSITTIEPANDKFIVNGKHDQSKLAQVLDLFIEKFVLCKKCQRNPETYMVIRSGIIELKCMACGGRSPVDNRHKLCTFILKNPPAVPTEYEKKAKQAAAKAKKATGQEENGADPSEEGNGKEEDKLPRTSSKNGKKKKPAREEEEDDDDVVWFTDTSKEAAEQRRKNMLDNTSELAAKLLNTGISEKESKPDPLADVNAFLATKPPPSNSAIAGQLKKTKEEFKLSDEDTARLAFLTLFPTDVFKQLKTNKLDILKQFVTNEDTQRGALAAITELCKDAAGLKVVAHVLKYLYDEDVLEEDAVLKWYGAKSKGDEKKVKEAAKVFVEWLENAEEDEDEDEEDDTDDDEEEEEEDEDEDEEEEDSD